MSIGPDSLTPNPPFLQLIEANVPAVLQALGLDGLVSLYNNGDLPGLATLYGNGDLITSVVTGGGGNLGRATRWCRAETFVPGAENWTPLYLDTPLLNPDGQLNGSGGYYQYACSVDSDGDYLMIATALLQCEIPSGGDWTTGIAWADTLTPSPSGSNNISESLVTVTAYDGGYQTVSIADITELAEGSVLQPLVYTNSTAIQIIGGSAATFASVLRVN